MSTLHPPSIVALLAGTVLTIILLELFQKFKPFNRFKPFYFSVFTVGQIIIPALIYSVIFPYNGALAGMQEIMIFVYSLVILFYFYILLLMGWMSRIKRPILFYSCLSISYCMLLLTMAGKI